MDRISCSQPEMPQTSEVSPGGGFGSGSDVLAPMISFSQPLQPDNMLLSSQIQCTPGLSQVNILQNVIQYISVVNKRYFSGKFLPKSEIANKQESV